MFMRSDSCRKCGNEMEAKNPCPLCKNPTKFECKDCHSSTEEQIHLQCLLIDMDYKLLETKAA